jgi:glycosyltransferase involved in cell wall biosynthesis
VSELPPISVVIPTYNRASVVTQSIRAALTDPVVREVIVVDDGSTDDTPATLRALARVEARVRVVRVDNAGAPRARDRGAHEATADVVAFVDDDVVVAPGTLTGHARHHADGGHKVVIGYMPVALDGPRQGDDSATRLYAADYERHCRRFDELEGRDLLLELWGGQVSMRREDALAVGLYSDHYALPRHEDRDVGIRLAKAGLDAVFDRELVARHEHTRSLARGLEDARLQVRGRHRLHELHGDLLGPWEGSAPYAEGLKGAPRLVARIGRVRGVGAVEVALLKTAARLSGRVHRHRWQVGASAVARTIVQQTEARRLERAGAR